MLPTLGLRTGRFAAGLYTSSNLGDKSSPVLVHMQKHCNSSTANILVQLPKADTASLQVERVRLNYKSAGMRRPSREQEVLHYQWFADLGSVEAQRAVGQIFSHGALRNPEQALRYFR